MLLFEQVARHAVKRRSKRPLRRPLKTPPTSGSADIARQTSGPDRHVRPAVHALAFNSWRRHGRKQPRWQGFQGISGLRQRWHLPLQPGQPSIVPGRGAHGRGITKGTLAQGQAQGAQWVGQQRIRPSRQIQARESLPRQPVNRTSSLVSRSFELPDDRPRAAARPLPTAATFLARALGPGLRLREPRWAQ